MRTVQEKEFVGTSIMLLIMINMYSWHLSRNYNEEEVVRRICLSKMFGFLDNSLI
jgi:hypothetical protein